MSSLQGRTLGVITCSNLPLKKIEKEWAALGH